MFVIFAVLGLVFIIITSIKDIFTKANVYHIKRENNQKKSA